MEDWEIKNSIKQAYRGTGLFHRREVLIARVNNINELPKNISMTVMSKADLSYILEDVYLHQIESAFDKYEGPLLVTSPTGDKKVLTASVNHIPL